MSELPSGWARLQLSEIVKEGTATVDPRGFPDEEFDLFSIPSFSEGAPERVLGAHIGSTKQFVQQDDVLLSKIVPHIRRVWVVPRADGRRQIASGEWIVYRSAHVEPHFIRLALSESSFRAKFLGTVSGVGGSLMRASPKRVAEFFVSLPPLGEQKRIVAKLDALNAKSVRARTELARIETLVSRYNQAVLSKAFSGELTREWRYLAGRMAPVMPRHAQQVKPAYRLTLEQAFEAPYDLPTPWEWLTLPSLGDLDRGKSRHRPRNDPRLFDGPYPFIQTGDVRAAHQYVREHSQTYSEFGLAQSKLWQPETLCITIAANIAETALLSYPACFPDSVVGFSADADKMLPKYAEFFLRTAKERISQFAPATAQKNINLEILAAVRLPVPSLEEQHEIVRRIESAFAKIDRLAGQARRALELVGRMDEAILAKAFRGELVPQDESDEPADKLLERIGAERAAAPKEKPNSIGRKITMITARNFLKEKMQNWPEDGVSFQDLRGEFIGSYDDLKDAIFASLSDEKSMLRQVFDEKRSMMTLRKRER